MTKNGRIPYLFLTSHAYSGSTLTSFLINAHPEIASVGELIGPALHLDMNCYLCSCGQRLRDDPFWHAVAQVLNRRGVPFSPSEHFHTSLELGSNRLAKRLRSKSLRCNAVERSRDLLVANLWPKHSQEFEMRLKRNIMFARAILDVTGKTFFLDASKDPMRIHYLRSSRLLDFYVIHLVRDVRGVVTSIINRRPGMSVRKATRHWLVAEHNIRRHLREIPASRQMRLRYEDLATDTLAEMNRVFAFVGAEPVSHLATLKDGEHHILGNKMRKSSVSQVKLDERWRSTLSSSDLRLISRMVGANR